MKLSEKVKDVKARLEDEYDLTDAGAQAILGAGLMSLERAERCRKVIEKEGELVVDRFGKGKAHPLCAVERDARAQWLAALKMLNLDILPNRDGPGRPPGKR